MEGIKARRATYQNSQEFAKIERKARAMTRAGEIPTMEMYHRALELDKWLFENNEGWNPHYQSEWGVLDELER